MQQPRTLVMFAKYPHAGAVKTRLALGEQNKRDLGLQAVRHRDGASMLGEQAALEHSAGLYEAFLRDRVATHAAGDYRFLLGVSGENAGAKFADLLGTPIDSLILEGESMGDLLRSALQQLLPGRVLITASDYPVLDEGIVDEAYAALDDVDVVLVPAADGAYNLIGMRNYHDIFDLSAWSSGNELEETETLLRDRGISHRVLRDHVIRDVDTMADLHTVMGELDVALAPHTAATLDQWTRQFSLSA